MINFYAAISDVFFAAARLIKNGILISAENIRTANEFSALAAGGVTHTQIISDDLIFCAIDDTQTNLFH